MASKKSKKSADRPSWKRYHAEGHRRRNKMRRILRCNGQRFLNRWKVDHPEK